MRSLPGILLALIAIASVHGQSTSPQINNLNVVISLLPQIQAFLDRLDTIVPQLTSALSSAELQSLKDKATQVILTELLTQGGLRGVISKLRPLLQQSLGPQPQGRIDIDAILQQIINAAVSALPGLLISLIGKRDVSDTRAAVTDILSWINLLPANHINVVLNALPQISALISQLNGVLGQFKSILSSVELQSLKDKVIQLILAQAGTSLDLNALKDKLLALLHQVFDSKPQNRLDIDAVLQQIVSTASSVLPGLLISLLGKRDVADTRALLSLTNEYSLSTLLPQLTQYLNADKLKQLQNQTFATIITALGNHWPIASIGQALQQVVTQFVPQVAQLRINWEALAQSALNGLVSALPSVAIGLISLLGKRDLNADPRSLLAHVPAAQLAQLLQIVNNVDQAKQATVLARMEQLLPQIFPTHRGRMNFDDLASNLLDHLSNLLPSLSQAMFSSIMS